MFRDNVHNLRAIAIILVVLTHVISAVSSNGDVSVILLRSLSQNASVLFTIIAGYLFFELNQTFVYKRFIAKKLKNSVIPYVICSIPAILIYTLSLKTSHVWIDMEWFHSISMIEQIGFMLVSGGHLGPYWFIPVILMMYFISPVLYRISYSRHVVIWLVVLSAIAIYVGRPSLNSNVIHSLIYFIPVFLFGQYLSQTKIHEKIARVNTFVFSLFVGVTLVITYLSFQYSHNMDFPLKIALLFFLFSLTYRLLNLKINILKLIENMIFPIFFIHGYLIAFMRNSNYISKLSFNALELVSIALFILFICSTIAITVNKVFGNKSRYITGY